MKQLITYLNIYRIHVFFTYQLRVENTNLIRVSSDLNQIKSKNIKIYMCVCVCIYESITEISTTGNHDDHPAGIQIVFIRIELVIIFVYTYVC